ncbi:MAG: glycoside hydrolase family 5 protein [Actinobacteria bacterium]|nr:MAG: glycoside hydrolase family 5 protein [Actinomycetota bacterium]
MAGCPQTGAGRPTRLIAALLIGLSLGLCVATLPLLVGEASGSPRARPAVAAMLGGVNVTGVSTGVSPAVADFQIAAARRLHSRVVRAEVRWSALEPLQAGQIDAHALAFTDRLVRDAAAAHIGVILAVDNTPCWASSAPAQLLRRCVPSMSTQANAWPPINPADYASVVAYLARRYGTHLAAIEIWNEPDQSNQLYFDGPNKAQRYATILRSAYSAIKQADPNVPVLAGSLVGSNGVFLRALYAAGIKGYYDGLAVHFYNLVLGSLRAIHETQLANGDAKPLWLDEFGWSSCYPRRKLQEEQACVTPRTQAANLVDIFRSLRRTPYVAAAVVYNLRNSGQEDFGLLNGSGARKPAFAALSRVLSSPFGNPRPVRLGLRRRGGRVLASGSAPVGDYMQLEAFIGGVLRYRALFTLDRFNRYSISLPHVLGTRHLRVRVYQLWAGPRRAAVRTI